jgi:hypothetical protein
MEEYVRTALPPEPSRMVRSPLSGNPLVDATESVVRVLRAAPSEADPTVVLVGGGDPSQVLGAFVFELAGAPLVTVP